jgi:hypothetical protein
MTRIDFDCPEYALLGAAITSGAPREQFANFWAGREAMAKDAQRLLSEMLVLLARMRGDLKQAQKRLQDIDADAARD